MYKYIIHQKEIKKRLETCGLKRHIFNHTVKLMCSFIKNLAVLKLRFNIQRDEQLQRITELQDFIKDQSSDLTVFDEALVKRWLKQIVIWPTHCTVELKSGLKVDVER